VIALYLVAALAVFAAIRATLEKNTGRKLPYVNVMNSPLLPRSSCC